MSDTRCYMIVTCAIHDRERFISGYGAAARQLVHQFGGRYLLMAAGAEALEGDFGDGASVVISEWPDRSTVQRFWNSPEYAEAKKLRDGIADVQVVIVDAPGIGA